MKRNNMKEVTFVSIGALVAAVALLVFAPQRTQVETPKQVLGAAAVNTSTSTYSFGTTVAGSNRQLKTTAGVLTAVVITNETAGSFSLYDATSTNHGNHATTTLFTASPNLAEGTYILNVGFSRGLLFETQSANVASGTILYQ